MLAATPLGATVADTGEFLLGTVGVVPIFFESDGRIDPESQDWSEGEAQAVLEKIRDGVGWWSRALDRLDTVHSLEFVVDDTYAVNPVETPYEPIDRISNSFDLYAGGFLESLGYGDSPSFEAAVHRFNHDQRVRLGTDWAFSIFVVDSSDDPNGEFAPGGHFSTAFAFAGGLFFVLPSTRPVSTVAHEMGHIFWARDEYPGGGSCTDERGYYNAQNLNAADGDCDGPPQQISIMRSGTPLATAYTHEVSPDSTLAMVGWRDSDGDGIFDVADVPLELEGVGYFDAAESTYHFRGSASAVPLQNQNSSGPQSDITLNRISRLEYRLDNGPWRTAASPDTQQAEFELAIDISEPFSEIAWRAIDDATGITSPVIEADALATALSPAAIAGYAYLDENGNASRDADEPLLANTEITVRHADGSELLAGTADAADLPEEEIVNPIGGLALGTDGLTLDGRIGVFPSEALGGRPVFQAFDLQRQSWVDQWTERVALQAQLDVPVGQLTVDFRGFPGYSRHNGLAYARVEAYDAAGAFLGRATSAGVAGDEAGSVTIEDPRGRISSIRVFGHADSRIAIERIEFGTEATVITDASGAWRLPNLADGTYRIDVVPQRVIHQLGDPSWTVEVVNGFATPIEAAASRVTSPRHRAEMPYDVNGDDEVSALDALLVINDLNRFESRILGRDELVGPAIDVNDDGSVSALDALLVINRLNRHSPPSGEGEAPPSDPAAPQRATVSAAITTFNPFGTPADRDAETRQTAAPEEKLSAPAIDSALAQWQTDRGLSAETILPPASDESANRSGPSGRPLLSENPELFLKPTV